MTAATPVQYILLSLRSLQEMRRAGLYCQGSNIDGFEERLDCCNTCTVYPIIIAASTGDVESRIVPSGFQYRLVMGE